MVEVEDFEHDRGEWFEGAASMEGWLLVGGMNRREGE